MNPALVAVAGPLQGQSRALAEGPNAIGRDLTNAVSIADGSVSRRHCQVQGDANAWTIRDLDSLNGTFVNGVPVRERPLSHGDQIQVGTSLFVFLLQDGADGVPSASVRLHEGEVHLGSTARMRPRQSPGAGRLTGNGRGLGALLKAGRLVSSVRGEDALARGIVDVTLEATAASRCAIFFASSTTDEFSEICGRTRSDGESSMAVSRTLVARVLREGEAILANQVAIDEGLQGIESLAASPIRALAVVPVSLDRTLGVLYVDSSDPAVAFSEDDLQLLLGLATMAATALERLRQLPWREEPPERSSEALISGLVGESPAMKRVEQFLARVAPTGSTVLILGESGTGKELAARALHRNGPRAARAFVAVNCAALSEQLLESELFGHERGAFTGAIAQKKGKLELADGGSVFLDEVGELTGTLQAKLLRVLEQREFERLGGTRPIRVDIRLIAATNRNLEEAIAAGHFREDLYYRLNVVALTMPPLRERPADIPLLASFFAARYAGNLNRPVPGFSPAARACLLQYEWPGNVRELSNAIERAVVLGGDVIGTEDLPESVVEAGQAGKVALSSYHEAVQETKKRVIRQAVDEAGGNYTEAARRLGVHPNYLHRLIRNLDLKGDLRR